MDTDKLRTTVAELENQLRSNQTIDDQTRQMLEQAAREIRAALHEDESEAALGSRSLVDRLQDALGKFEGGHPTLTVTVSRLIDGLAQMGI